jgi:two-component system, chemotaxis family, sensor kinase CheA
LGQNDSNIEIQSTEYEALLAEVVSKTDHDTLASLLSNWKLEPSARRLMRLAEGVRSTAKKLGKENIIVRIEDNGVRLPAYDYKDFFSQLIHVARNAVDHGVETPSERKAKGKAEMATISLSTEVKNNSLRVSISDDGNGVNWNALKLKAEKLGMRHETKEDLVDALFADGVSTRASVSATSGRGVGASAAKESCLSIGGKVHVESEQGLGTKFHFDLPVFSGEVKKNNSKIRKAG